MSLSTASPFNNNYLPPFSFGFKKRIAKKARSKVCGVLCFTRQFLSPLLSQATCVSLLVWGQALSSRMMIVFPSLTSFINIPNVSHYISWRWLCTLVGGTSYRYYPTNPKRWSAQSKNMVSKIQKKNGQHSPKRCSTQYQKMVNTVPKDSQHTPKRSSTQSQKMVNTVPKDSQHSPNRCLTSSQMMVNTATKDDQHSPKR